MEQKYKHAHSSARITHDRHEEHPCDLHATSEAKWRQSQPDCFPLLSGSRHDKAGGSSS